MLEVGKKEFWFVVGSQHLYGEEALQTVKNNAAVIVESLNNSGKLPYPLVSAGIGGNARYNHEDHERSELPR